MIYNIKNILKEIIIIINPEIEEFYFNIFPSNQLIQNTDNSNEKEKKQLQNALYIREKYGFSFWESLMSTFLNNSEPNFKLLKYALRHNKNNNVINYRVKDFNNFQNFIDNNKDNNLAFISKVKIKGQIKHFPLIDFHIKPSSENTLVVEEVLKMLNLNSGYLINSGKSYHFISKKIVSQNELEKLLAQMIFFSPIIDRNWVAHQLIEKMCALRVTQGEKSELKIVKEYSA